MNIQILSGRAGIAGNTEADSKLERSVSATADIAAKLAQLDGPFSAKITSDDDHVVALSVDRFAVETLCYTESGSELKFSSRATSLRSASNPIRPQGIFDYLFFHVIPSPETIFDGIHRIPPGHYVGFNGKNPQSVAYWSPEFAPARGLDLNVSKQQFVQLLQSSVARELSDGPTGCFLSGGTDSSTVAGMIAKVTGQSPMSFSIGFDEAGYDEMSYARIAARHFGTDHHEYYVTPDDLVRSIPLIARSHDQPFGNSSALPAYYCAKLAADHGVRKLLAGDGGDELFGGNSRYAKQKMFDWYRKAPGPVQHLLETTLLNSPIGGWPGARKAASYVQQGRLPMPERTHLYNLLTRLGPDRVLTARFLARIDQQAPARLQRQVWDEAVSESDLDKHLAFDWRFTLADCDIPKVRGAVSLAGIAAGFPLMSKGLLEFSMTLPPEWKVNGSKLRWFFKEALKDFLPQEIILKPKQGFGLPFGVWACKHAPLTKLVNDTLGSLGTRGIVNEDFIESLTSDLIFQHPGYYGELVWILTILEHWLQEYAPDFKIED